MKSSAIKRLILSYYNSRHQQNTEGNGTMKKFLAVVLALMMVVTTGVVAFAASEGGAHCKR